MKKVRLIVLGAIIIIGGLCVFLLTKGHKYTYEEEAKIDNFAVILKKSSYDNETGILEAVFEVKNLNSYSVTLDEEKHFKLKNIADIELNNSYHSNINILKSNESTVYTIQYKIDYRPNYEIKFYSGIKDNNIKFSVNTLIK